MWSLLVFVLLDGRGLFVETRKNVLRQYALPFLACTRPEDLEAKQGLARANSAVMTRLSLNRGETTIPLHSKSELILRL